MQGSMYRTRRRLALLLGALAGAALAVLLLAAAICAICPEIGR